MNTAAPAVPARHDHLERAARQPHSITAAIRAMCWECVGRTNSRQNSARARREIAACTAWGCPLWGLRPWRRLAPAGHGQAERAQALAQMGADGKRSLVGIGARNPNSRRAALNAKCGECMGGDRALISGCASHFPRPASPEPANYRGCPLWPHRPGQNRPFEAPFEAFETAPGAAVNAAGVPTPTPGGPDGSECPEKPLDWRFDGEALLSPSNRNYPSPAAALKALVRDGVAAPPELAALAAAMQAFEAWLATLPVPRGRLAVQTAALRLLRRRDRIDGRSQVLEADTLDGSGRWQPAGSRRGDDLGGALADLYLRRCMALAHGAADAAAPAREQAEAELRDLIALLPA